MVPSSSIKGLLKVPPLRVNTWPGAMKRAMLIVAVSLLVSAPLSLIDNVSVVLPDGVLVLSL